MKSEYPYGSNRSILWDEDPKMLGVRLARYKFVAKMLEGMDVCEVGAGDGWFSRVVAQTADNLTITDANPQAEMTVWDPVEGPFGKFDAIYALDVIEHVPQPSEDSFMGNIVRSLRPKGVCIIGCPSLESQPFASRKSRESHVNCKTGPGLRELMRKHFPRVFLFGMNDEVVHTGFEPMCHYRLGVGVL